MSVLLFVLGALAILAGLVTLILPGVPGSALVYAGILLVAWSDGFQRIGTVMLILLGVLAIVASVVDNVAGILGARYGGASAWGLFGATAGAVVGLAFGLVGLLVGPAVGALVFEYVKNPNIRRAAGAGVGSLAGFLVGAVAKYVFTLFMVGVAALAYFSERPADDPATVWIEGDP